MTRALDFFLSACYVRPMTYPDYTAKRGELSATLTYIGEGFDGDFGEAEDDAPLYRLDLELPGKDVVSFCTLIEADLPTDFPNFIEEIVYEAAASLARGNSLRTVGQNMSWLDNSCVGRVYDAIREGV